MQQNLQQLLLLLLLLLWPCSTVPASLQLSYVQCVHERVNSC
jgi:hypothetical protein